MRLLRASLATALVLRSALAIGAPASSASASPPPSSSTSASPSAKPATKTKETKKTAPTKEKEKAKDAKKAEKDKDAELFKGDGPKPPGKSLTTPNAAIQKAVAGGPSAIDSTSGAESPELKALRDAEIDLFAGAAPLPGSPWPTDLPTAPKGPLALSGGLPPAPVEPPPLDVAVGSSSLTWLADLKMPDLPVRWDARVVRYLEFFKNDARGRKIMSLWIKRSGRYRALIQEMLRARSMPEDLAWVAMAESGFDPTIKSHAGAAGLWQFMPDAAKIYGLTIDRWADARNSPPRATEAAINYLGDLKKRFGTWELALAAYNMGYGGALAAVKKFDTNDFWELSKYENGLPWETTLYVPKIIALAIVTRNLDVFGYDGVAQEPALKGEPVDVPAGAELRAIASAAGCSLDEVKALNPELKAGRAPPAIVGKDASKDATLVEATYTVFVPPGKASAVKDAEAKLSPKGNTLEKWVVRFGETLDAIAIARKTTKSKLVEINGIAKDEAVRAGTVLLVPPLPNGSSSGGTAIAAAGDAGKPIVLVPSTVFAYASRDRVFYKVIVGDTPHAIADAFGVSVDELRTWNAIEPAARLQEGMTLQVFVSKSADLSKVVFSKEGDVRIVAVGSDEFYAIEEAQKGKKRVTVKANGGETLEQLGKKYGVTPASMEKINRRPRTDLLAKGEAVIVYVAAKNAPVEKAAPAPAAIAADDQPALPSTADDAVVAPASDDEKKPE